MPHDILAVDLALLLPDDVNEQAIKVNRHLWEQSHQGFLFDDSHIPHLTLAQQFVERERLPEIRQTIGELLASLSSPLLQIVGYELRPRSDSSHNVWWDIHETAELQAFRQQVMKTLEPFITLGGSAESFFLDPGSSAEDELVGWVRDFRSRVANQTYRTHLSLGKGLTPPPLSFPIDFKPTTVALCHMGKFGTCRKILGSWMLG